MKAIIYIYVYIFSGLSHDSPGAAFDADTGSISMGQVAGSNAFSALWAAHCSRLCLALYIG